jgi:hypothetical protein
MTELELENQKDLYEAAFARGLQQANEITDRVILESTPMLYNRGYQNGFIAGFAAGAFGVMLSLGVTWWIFS